MGFFFLISPNPHHPAQWEKALRTFSFLSQARSDQKAKSTGWAAAELQEIGGGKASRWPHLEAPSAPDGGSLLPAATPLDLSQAGNRAAGKRSQWELALQGSPRNVSLKKYTSKI